MWTSALAALTLVAATAADAQSAPPSMLGTWRGTYICLQGRTGLTLTIDRQTQGQFSGYFYFYPPPDNPALREGCYAVDGSVDLRGAVTVTAKDWITRPENYVTVGLSGHLALAGQTMSGNVVGAPGVVTQCRQFGLNRQSAVVAIAGACLSGVLADPDLAAQ